MNAAARAGVAFWIVVVLLGAAVVASFAFDWTQNQVVGSAVTVAVIAFLLDKVFVR